MGKTIAISQSNYIPWKGFFDLIGSVDEFVIFDEAQYTTRDWRNRNRIILAGKSRWLTIPIVKRTLKTPINEIRVADPLWAARHWAALEQAYRRAPCFAEYAIRFYEAYEQAGRLERLTDINEFLLAEICRFLQLSPGFSRSDDVPRSATTATGRLIEICRARGATTYVSGPSARNYIQEQLFTDAGIEIRYADYSDYPVYRQHADVFEHGVSILDTLFHCGEAARGHLKSVNRPDSFLPAAGRITDV